MKHDPGFMYQIEQSAVVLDHQAQAVEIVVSTVSDGILLSLEFFTGIAKVAPEDRTDYAFGYELAYWRAVKSACDKALRRLDGQIKHNDDVREMKQKQTAQRKKTGDEKFLEDWKVGPYRQDI